MWKKRFWIEKCLDGGYVWENLFGLGEEIGSLNYSSTKRNCLLKEFHRPVPLQKPRRENEEDGIGIHDEGYVSTW